MVVVMWEGGGWWLFVLSIATVTGHGRGCGGGAVLYTPPVAHTIICSDFHRTEALTVAPSPDAEQR